MRSLKLKAVKYCIINKHLFSKYTRGIFLNCVDEDEAQRSMVEMHKGACRGHHYWKATTYKILRVGYYCPTIFLDVNAKLRAYVEFQMFVGKQKLLTFPFKTSYNRSSFFSNGGFISLVIFILLKYCEGGWINTSLILSIFTYLN